MNRTILIVLCGLLLMGMAGAHGEEAGAASGPAASEPVNVMQYFVPVGVVASVLLLLGAGVAVVFRDQLTERGKKVVFGALAVVIIAPTLFMFGGTIYMNATSFTGGEVHWHADFRVYINGTQVELRDAEGLSNRVGTDKFHVHDDSRIHAEGIFLEREDVTLHRFFESVGGDLTETRIAMLTDEGWVNVTEQGEYRLMAFVKSGTVNDRSWRRLEAFPQYVLSPYSNVPPGDRIVITYSDRSADTVLADLRADDVIGTPEKTGEDGSHEEHGDEH